MLFSINILFVIPKITAIETIDDPPKLNKGKGKPVTGIKPTTVDIFIIIWKDSSAINPAITNLSKSESETVKILLSLLNNKPQRASKNKIPKKPKLYAYAAKIKSVVSTGTNIFSIFSAAKYCPNSPPLEISKRLWDWEKSRSAEKNSFKRLIWYWVTMFILSTLDPISKNIKNRDIPIKNRSDIYRNFMLDRSNIDKKTKEIINAVPRSGWKFISSTVPNIKAIKIPLFKFLER